MKYGSLDKQLYATALKELECDQADLGVWAMATAKTGGDAEKTRAEYINIRAQELFHIQKVAKKVERDHAAEERGRSVLEAELIKKDGTLLSLYRAKLIREGCLKPGDMLNRLLHEASRLDGKGEWDAAFALYKTVLDTTIDDRSKVYARTRCEQLIKKLEASGMKHVVNFWQDSLGL